MKAKKLIQSMTLFAAISIFLFISLMLNASCNLNNSIEIYHEIEIYKQQKYRDKEEFGEKVYFTGGNANLFLPKYEEIEYNYSDIDFYIFDGTKTLTLTAVTFVLDLKFDDKDEYESAKQNELSTRIFRTSYEESKKFEKPEFEFNLGNFLCKTVLDNDYPRRLGLVCLNDNSYILRYLYFEEWESPEYVPDKDYILQCTNCEW